MQQRRRILQNPSAGEAGSTGGRTPLVGTNVLYPGEVGDGTMPNNETTEFKPDQHSVQAAFLGYLLNQQNVVNGSCRSMFCYPTGHIIRTPTLDDYTFSSPPAVNGTTAEPSAVPWVGMPGAMALVGMSTRLLAMGTIDAIAGTFQVQHYLTRYAKPSCMHASVLRHLSWSTARALCRPP